MPSTDDWTVEFYEDESGRFPVREYLRGLAKPVKAKLGAVIRYVQEYNVAAREPHVRPITGKLWELRAEVDTNIYRIFYFFYTGKKIVLLHGFLKKTQKTPAREITIATQRMHDYINRKTEE